MLICSDCSDSKATVLQLARRLGFSPVDLGGLSASRDIEEAPLLLFPSWGGPFLATFLLFLFFYGYSFLKQILLPYLDRGKSNFSQLPLVTVNQTLPAVALVTLAAVYLPGANREQCCVQAERYRVYNSMGGMENRSFETVNTVILNI